MLFLQRKTIHFNLMLPLLIDQESYLFCDCRKSFLEANLIWKIKKQYTNILTTLSLCVYLLSQLLFVYKYDFQIIVDNHTFLTTVDFHIITWWPTLQKSINSKFEIMSNKYLYNLSMDKSQNSFENTGKNGKAWYLDMNFIQNKCKNC